MASQRKPRRPDDDAFDWFTISYKTIYIAVALLLLIGGGAYYHYFGTPMNPNPVIDVPAPTVTTARFTRLEGNVRVKTWRPRPFPGKNRNAKVGIYVPRDARREFGRRLRPL